MGHFLNSQELMAFAWTFAVSFYVLPLEENTKIGNYENTRKSAAYNSIGTKTTQCFQGAEQAR